MDEPERSSAASPAKSAMAQVLADYRKGLPPAAEAPVVIQLACDPGEDSTVCL